MHVELEVSGTPFTVHFAGTHVEGPRNKVKDKYSCNCNSPSKPMGTREFEDRLTDGGKVVSLTRQPQFCPPSRPYQEYSWYSFRTEVASTQDGIGAGRLRKIEKLQ
jgi:hypothetical protein